METPLALYLATIVGGIALLLMLPRQRKHLPALGAVIGAGALGGIWLFLWTRLDTLGSLAESAFAYYYVFSAIAIVAAVRVITHTRPVYSALWFVLVVLSSSGLLLVLSAEFMAFAMVIIYGGAILVTYMFVIMLATQSESPDAPAEKAELSPVYDRLAREPFSAVVAGFLLLAVLLTVSFPVDATQHPTARAASDEAIAEHVLADRPALEVEAGEGAGSLPTSQEQFASAMGARTEVSNAERIGVDLFRSHPLGLELAGVILLVSLIGAVVIAKTRIEEEETGEMHE